VIISLLFQFYHLQKFAEFRDFAVGRFSNQTQFEYFYLQMYKLLLKTPKRSFSTVVSHTPLKKVVIGGGSGFIGKALTNQLRKEGVQVDVISRTKERGELTWDEVMKNGLPDCDAVVNFAGMHILSLKRRWTPEYSNEVIESRVRTTSILVYDFFHSLF
jgi:hypothetical protein